MAVDKGLTWTLGYPFPTQLRTHHEKDQVQKYISLHI